MARPRSEDWHALKRVGRYLMGATRVVQQFHWTGDDTNLQGYADCDWAGDRQNMKSTSGGVIMHKGLVDFAICIDFELRRSRIVRHDKSVQLSGVTSMAKDFVVSVTRVVKSDSSSA